MCKRNSPQKCKVSVECLRETPEIKVKLAQDV